MKYMLLIHSDENAPMPPDDVMAEIMSRYYQVAEDLEKQGKLVASHRLRPTDTATTVKVRDGDKLVTDGPFAELKEALGGYYLIEAADLDEAITWAAKIPAAEHGSIEIRPVWEMEG